MLETRRVALLLDRMAIPAVEGLERAEKARHEEIEEGPQLAEMVLHRRAGQAQALLGAKLAHVLRDLRPRILDHLRFVEDHHRPRLRAQELHVAPHERVGGDDEIVAGNRLEPFAPLRPVPDEHAQIGGEARRLARPVAHEARGRHHQRRLLEPAGALFRQEMRERLQRLAQPHVVGQDPVQAMPAPELQPGQARALVGPHLRLQARRFLHRHGAAVALQLFEHGRQRRCLDLGQGSGRQLAQQGKIVARQPHRPLAPRFAPQQFQRQLQDGCDRLERHHRTGVFFRKGIDDFLRPVVLAIALEDLRRELREVDLALARFHLGVEREPVASFVGLGEFHFRRARLPLLRPEIVPHLDLGRELAQHPGFEPLAQLVPQQGGFGLRLVFGEIGPGERHPQRLQQHPHRAEPLLLPGHGTVRQLEAHLVPERMMHPPLGIDRDFAVAHFGTDAPFSLLVAPQDEAKVRGFLDPHRRHGGRSRQCFAEELAPAPREHRRFRLRHRRQGVEPLDVGPFHSLGQDQWPHGMGLALEIVPRQHEAQRHDARLAIALHVPHALECPARRLAP